MVELVAALAIAPWAQPLRFQPMQGWHSGASGTFDSSYGPAPGVASPKESTAWMAWGVRYRDRRTADPPGETLAHLPRRGILVFATIYESGRKTQKPIQLRLDRATRYPCCDGTYVAGGEYGLAGAGPARAYSVIVRVYFGSPPTRSMRAQAQRALDRLQLPRPSRSARSSSSPSRLPVATTNSCCTPVWRPATTACSDRLYEEREILQAHSRGLS